MPASPKPAPDIASPYPARDPPNGQRGITSSHTKNITNNGAGGFQSTKDGAARASFRAPMSSRTDENPGLLLPTERIKAGNTAPPSGSEAISRFVKKRRTQMVIDKNAAPPTKTGVAERLSNAVKEVLSHIQTSPTLIIAAASVVVISFLLLGMTASIVGSPFGIFYSMEDNTADTMSISAVVARINGEYNRRIQDIKNANTCDSVEVHGAPADFVEVVAVFAVRTTTRADELSMDVVTIDPARADLMREVFWDMTEITYEIENKSVPTEITNDDDEIETEYVTERVLHIYVNSKSYSEMPAYYDFTKAQADLLADVMEQRALIVALIGHYRWHDITASIAMSDDDLYALVVSYDVTLPDNLSIERKNVLKAAFAGVQVNIPYHYTWHSVKGVYSGLDGNDFGSTVPADPKGRTRKGLDCSGFVGWAYQSAGITWSGFGYGESDGKWYFYATPGMRAASSMSKIQAADLKPGDIGFISDSASGTSDHTGIYLGVASSGTRIWLHCAGGSGAICGAYNFGVSYTVLGMD